MTIKDIAGYATERMAWQLILDLSNQESLHAVSSEGISIDANHFVLNDKLVTASKVFAAPETFTDKKGTPSEASDIWTIGALVFYAITGTDVFEGKGGETQTHETEVPRIGSAHASHELSALIRRCLHYSPIERPTMEEIRRQAQEALARPSTPRKRLTSQVGKNYTASLVKFWPEEMVPFLLMCLLTLQPFRLSAQTNDTFDKSAISIQMAKLVNYCIDLRTPQNMEKVSKALDRDMSWTLMDELPTANGECKPTDAVDVFDLNNLGVKILKRHGGVVNTGGKFRDGRDPKYKYSFIEITVKKGATVTYELNGREGEQLFAVIPFIKDAAFEASVVFNNKEKTGTHIDGVSYILLRQGIKRDNKLTLTIKNKSGKNMAFAIINYNSRNNE